MENELFKLIANRDLEKIKKMLAADPKLVNVGVALNDNRSAKKGHPLHRLCDVIFEGKITDEQAIEIAKIFLNFGADVDGYKLLGDNNTPLIAAASLYAEKLGIFYINQGADIFYAPASNGATALHWASFCGMDKLVKELIAKGGKVNQPDTTYNSTPAGWAIHALILNNSNNLNHQLACAKLLLGAGADRNLLNSESMQYLIAIAKDDKELEELIK